MDVEESQLAALIVADSSSSLAVQALEEANELLGLENARLRNNNRVLRTVVRALRSKSTELFQHVDELQQHIFLTAAQEDELSADADYALPALCPTCSMAGVTGAVRVSHTGPKRWKSCEDLYHQEYYLSGSPAN